MGGWSAAMNGYARRQERKRQHRRVPPYEIYIPIICICSCWCFCWGFACKMTARRIRTWCCLSLNFSFSFLCIVRWRDSPVCHFFSLLNVVFVTIFSLPNVFFLHPNNNVFFLHPSCLLLSLTVVVLTLQLCFSIFSFPWKYHRFQCVPPKKTKRLLGTHKTGH